MSKLNPLAVVLSIVDPEYPEDADFEALTQDRKLLAKAIKLAARNGLNYLFFQRLRELNEELSLVYAERFEEEEQNLNIFMETISLLDDVLQSHGIDYIVIKECSTLPNIPRDVDIFIPQYKKDELIKAFETKCMKCVHSDDIETTLVGEGYLSLDVYTRICYFGVDCIDEAFLLNSCCINEVCKVKYPGLQGEADLLLTVVHSLFGHGRMTLLDFLNLKTLKRNVKDPGFCREYAIKHGWGEVFDSVMRQVDSLYEKMYQRREIIRFPYSFGQDFMVRCAYTMAGFKPGRFGKMVLYVSFAWDSIIIRTQGSLLYNVLRSIKPVRKIINSLGYLIRYMRGDRYS
ncbi:hypothetical protein ACFLTS_01570 [Chloroflexota bacterium]